MPGDTNELATLRQAWQQAAASPAIALELEAIYTYLSAEIESRGPACWASGRCCNFAKAGHRLYVTGLEAAYVVARLEHRPLALADIHAARARGDCPFLDRNLCGVHAIKPLGCRAYFCDRSAQDWQQALSERGLARLRTLHDRHDIPYRYGEWREMLEIVVGVAPA